MELIFRAAIVLGVVAILSAAWRAGRPKRYFTVRVVAGALRVEAGPVTPAFLGMIREVVADNGLKAGRVSGVARGAGIGLEFSRNIPPGARQQLRNAWGVSGWKGARIAARRR